MSEPAERHPIALKKVVYQIPGMALAVVRRDVPYGTADAPAGTMDLLLSVRSGVRRHVCPPSSSCSGIRREIRIRLAARSRRWSGRSRGDA